MYLKPNVKQIEEMAISAIFCLIDKKIIQLFSK